MAYLIVNILGSWAQGQRESATRKGRHGARLIWIVRRTGKGSLLWARYQRQQGIKNYCGQKCSVLFARYCCRELIVGGVFCRFEFFVECFRAECFLEARQFLWRNSLMSMNRGLETVMIIERIVSGFCAYARKQTIIVSTNFEWEFPRIELAYTFNFFLK